MLAWWMNFHLVAFELVQLLPYRRLWPNKSVNKCELRCDAGVPEVLQTMSAAVEFKTKEIQLPELPVITEQLFPFYDSQVLWWQLQRKIWIKVNLQKESVKGALCYLVGRWQPGPGFVSASVIVLSFGHFHVVAETNEDLSFSQLVHCRPLIQLESRKNCQLTKAKMFAEHHKATCTWARANLNK